MSADWPAASMPGSTKSWRLSVIQLSLAQPPEVGSAAETAAAARAGHRSTLPLAAERDSLAKSKSQNKLENFKSSLASIRLPSK